jgi:phage terminase large subunit-like protein
MADRVYNFKFHPAQAAIYNSKARFKIAVAGRRFGKTYFACVMLGIAALAHTNYAGHALGPEHGVYYIGPTQEQAKRNVWRRLRLMLKYEAQGGFIKSENINDGYFELINGRRIYIKGADNEDSLRGEGYSYVVMDEYADMKAHVWEEIIDPALMDVEGEALFIGTPKGKNHFYKLFMEAMKGTNPIWEAFHFKSADNPFIKQSEIDRIRNNPNKSKDVIRQELDAVFLSGGGKVLTRENFPIIDRIGRGFGSTFVTVDLAGFKTADNGKILKTDESVIAVTATDEEEWLVKNVMHGHWDVRETALNIAMTIRDNRGCRIGVEQGALKNAVGPYLEEYLRTFGLYVHIEELRHNNQRKQDRIAWALQGRSERGKIKLLRGSWNEYLLEQVDDFPDPLSHDDGIDALSYVDQLATANFVASQDIDEWEPLDLEAGV